MGKFWRITLPVTVILVYRKIPVPARRRMFGPGGTSAHALEAVRAGGGWGAFWHDALPRHKGGVAGWPYPYAHGGPFDWEHYKSG